ncbi:hypothetical protein LK459_16430 [Gordonia otitidis]|uniref:hypothetical protein n=1 Tax=Gordonia otitidis TaxID=249058 RepID=UPI001D153876|nr:hypothetical protein [Gordonia otitidis]UEA58171.1 hypothetical protein LK459_16430 [Gordonia otitidis]
MTSPPPPPDPSFRPSQGAFEMPPTPAPGDYAATPAIDGPILVSIGDIACTHAQVFTPVGSAPVRGSRWSFVDLSRTTREIPQWAIIVAVITAVLFCGLGLLFLLVKEDRTIGLVQVSVAAGNLTYTTAIPVASAAAIGDLMARVEYAQSLAYQA